MALAKKKIHTTEDIYQLPEGDRAELIDGDLYMMSPPNTTHQRISAALHAEIYNYIRTHGGKCETFAAPFAVFLNTEADDRNYVDPEKSRIMVYSFTANSGNEYTFSDTVTPSIYDDLEIDFSAI